MVSSTGTTTATSSRTSTSSGSSSSASSSSGADSNGSSGGGSNAGAIAGGVVGGVVGLAAIIGLVLFFLRKRKGSANRKGAATGTAELGSDGAKHELENTGTGGYGGQTGKYAKYAPAGQPQSGGVVEVPGTHEMPAQR